MFVAAGATTPCSAAARTISAPSTVFCVLVTFRSLVTQDHLLVWEACVHWSLFGCVRLLVHVPHDGVVHDLHLRDLDCLFNSLDLRNLHCPLLRLRPDTMQRDIEPFCCSGLLHVLLHEQVNLASQDPSSATSSSALPLPTTLTMNIVSASPAVDGDKLERWSMNDYFSFSANRTEFSMQWQRAVQ